MKIIVYGWAIHNGNKMASNDLLTFILKDDELFEKVMTKAINNGEPEIINKVVEFLPSIDEEKRDDIIRRVIYDTIRKLTPEVLEILLKNLSHKTFGQPRGNPVLKYCIIAKRDDLLKKLLENCDIDPLEEIHHPDFRRNIPPLFIALINENYDGAKLLMEYGADINQMCEAVKKYSAYGYYTCPYAPYVFSPRWPLCYQVLQHCSEKNKEKITEFVLNHGADLSDSEKLWMWSIGESAVKKIEDFYKEPKKRAKPDQD